MKIVANLIILGLIMLISGLLIQNKSSWKSRLSISTFRRSYDHGIVSKIINEFVPAKNSRRYRQLTKLIENSFLNVDVKKVYFYKLLSAVVVSIMAVLISLTNSGVEKMEIINKANALLHNAVGEELYKSISMDKLMPQLSRINVFNMSRNDVLAYINELLAVRSGVTSIPSSVSIIIYDALLSMPRDTALKAAMAFTLSIIVGYWIPDMVLLAIAKLKSKKFDSEIQNLEMLTIVVGSVPNVTARDIIEELVKSSKVFKPILSEFYKDYLVDRAEAYKKLFTKSVNKDFERLMFTLRQIELSDKETALNALALARESRKQSRKLLSEEWVRKKEFIATLSYIAVAGLLLRMILVPWLREVSVITDITNMFK